MSTQSTTYENLIAGDQRKIVNVKATIKQGQVITRGTLLGKITASGKLTEAVAAHNDGTQNPYAIAAEDVDATAGDVVTTVYTEGEFNDRAVVYSYTSTADDWRAACQATGIYLRPAVPVY